MHTLNFDKIIPTSTIRNSLICIRRLCLRTAVIKTKRVDLEC